MCLTVCMYYTCVCMIKARGLLGWNFHVVIRVFSSDIFRSWWRFRTFLFWFNQLSVGRGINWQVFIMLTWWWLQLWMVGAIRRRRMVVNVSYRAWNGVDVSWCWHTSEINETIIAFVVYLLRFFKCYRRPCSFNPTENAMKTYSPIEIFFAQSVHVWLTNELSRNEWVESVTLS